mmetsp:Transcript_6171/g.16791  ORF Transcript_6171/g.16791 Transcript_6171/m.16791 type:complete len:287 (-) Transcript_6171:541-1401(-)
MNDVRDVGHVCCQVVALGACLDVEVSRRTIQQQMSRDLATGMILVNPLIPQPLLLTEDLVAPLFLSLRSFSLRDELLRDFMEMMKMLESFAASQQLVMLRLHVLQPVCHVRHRAMAHVVASAPTLSVHKQTQGGVRTDELDVVAQVGMAHAIYLSDEDRKCHLLGLLVIQLRVGLAQMLLVVLRGFVHDFRQCFPSRCQIAAMAAPRGVKVHEDVIVIVFGVLQRGLVQTDRIFTIGMHLLQRFRDGGVVEHNVLLVAVASLVSLTHTACIDLPFRYMCRHILIRS